MSLMIPPPLSALGVSYESLDGSHRKAIEEMREAFKNYDYPEKHAGRPTLFELNDYLFYKYLQHEDFDVGKAISALKKNIDWRTHVRPEELSWDRTPGLHKETKIMGKSLAGHPILFCKMSHWHPAEYTDDMYMKGRALEMEEARREMAQDGWKVDRIIVINDMRGFSMFEHSTQHAYRLSKVLMAFFGSAYIDSVETIYLLNAPLPFQVFWNIVRNFVYNDVMRRIRFENNASSLLDTIAPDQLYTRYGGTKEWDYYET